MYASPWLSLRDSRNVHQCSACLVKKGRMRAMEQRSNEANIFNDAPDHTPPNLIYVENLGQGTFRSEHCFLHKNITMLWLNQNLSHRASSN